MTFSIAPRVRRGSRLRSPVAIAGLVLAFAAPAVEAQRRTIQTCAIVRSGGGQGIRYLAGNAGSPLSANLFGPAEFDGACGGNLAVEVPPNAGWCASLPDDPLARWIAVDASRTPRSALYCHPFLFEPCQMPFATLLFSFCADDRLADPSSGPGPNVDAVYLNGNRIPGINGGSFGTQTSYLVGLPTAWFNSGLNRLHVYVRDTAAVVSGVIYSARICYDACENEDLYVLRSGNGTINGPDAQIHCIFGPTAAPLRNVPFVAADFTAACAAPAPFIVPPQVTSQGPWCPALVADPLAQWISSLPGAFPHSTLFCHPFFVRGCAVISATLTLDFSIDDSLGDPLGTPNLGVFLNGIPIAGSVVAGAAGTLCNLKFTAPVPPGVLVGDTINNLFVYDRDINADKSGVIYSAKIRVRTCAHPETILLRTGNGSVNGPDAAITMLTGGPAAPLRAAAFAPIDFIIACNGAAPTIVAPFAGWCPSLPADPLAQWIAPTAQRGPASALFCQSFDVRNCTSGIRKARLWMQYACDDHLGDLANGGGNPAGVYINNVAIAGTGTVGGSPATLRTLTADVTAAVRQGTNALQVYNRDAFQVVSGVIYTAKIDILPCRPIVRIGWPCGRDANLVVNRGPVLGQPFDLEVTGGPPLYPLFQYLGAGDTLFGAVPLPFDLTPFGAPGCQLHAAPEIVLTGLCDVNGRAGWSLPLPNDPSLIDVTLFTQSVLFDPAANAFGLSLSQGLMLTLEP